MSRGDKTKIPPAQIVYGETIYWITILAAVCCMIGPCLSLMFVDRNVLNPYYLFAAIFAGQDAATVWSQVGGGFPGGHFWAHSPLLGDGFTQLGLALGCSGALWALLAATVAYLRQRVFVYTVLSLWVALLVFLSAVGIAKGH